MRKITCVLAALCMAFIMSFMAKNVLAAELETYKNSIGMEFVLIPAGHFSWESIGTKVIVSKPFYLGKYEVTQEEWAAIMGAGSDKSFNKGIKNPVDNVSWENVQVFISKLNQKEGHNRYRLPTEAEWELAARGGTDTKYFFGDDLGTFGEYAWVLVKGKFHNKTSPVGQRKPNPYGLYDVYGNVWEWCHDRAGNLPKGQEITDYQGAASGPFRVLRGGGWNTTAENFQSGDRNYRSPNDKYDNNIIGFRLALTRVLDN